MTGYTVVWTQEALDELADLWLRSDDRSAVTRATATIDARLSNAPDSAGQAIAEGLCKLVAQQLTVYYAVRAADRIVEIAMVTTAGDLA